MTTSNPLVPTVACACSPACRSGTPWETHNCTNCGTWSAPHGEYNCPEYIGWAVGIAKRERADAARPPTRTTLRARLRALLSTARLAPTKETR